MPAPVAVAVYPVINEFALRLALASREASVDAVAADATPVPVASPLITGVPSVGVVPKTKRPVPVLSVCAERRFADDGVASHVATPVPRPVMEPTAGVTVVFPEAVISPLPLTVKVPTWVAEPKEPTFAFTVARVVAKLFALDVTSPDIAAVWSAEPENARVAPSVIPVAFAREPVALPTNDEAATCWNLA